MQAAKLDLQWLERGRGSPTRTLNILAQGIERNLSPIITSILS